MTDPNLLYPSTSTNKENNKQKLKDPAYFKLPQLLALMSHNDSEKLTQKTKAEWHFFSATVFCIQSYVYPSVVFVTLFQARLDGALRRSWRWRRVFLTTAQSVQNPLKIFDPLRTLKPPSFSPNHIFVNQIFICYRFHSQFFIETIKQTTKKWNYREKTFSRVV